MHDYSERNYLSFFIEGLSWWRVIYLKDFLQPEIEPRFKLLTCALHYYNFGLRKWQHLYRTSELITLGHCLVVMIFRPQSPRLSIQRSKKLHFTRRDMVSKWVFVFLTMHWPRCNLHTDPKLLKQSKSRHTRKSTAYSIRNYWFS